MTSPNLPRCKTSFSFPFCFLFNLKTGMFFKKSAQGRILCLNFYEDAEAIPTATVYYYIRPLTNVFQYLLTALAVCLKVSVCFNWTIWPTKCIFGPRFHTKQFPPPTINYNSRSRRSRKAPTRLIATASYEGLWVLKRAVGNFCEQINSRFLLVM